MPGEILSFSCPCGYRTENIHVGATREGHHRVVLCDTCGRILSIWRRYDEDDPARTRTCGECGQEVRGGGPLLCRGCGKPLTDVTAPGVWGPPELQRLFPDLEPWLVDTDHLRVGSPDDVPWEGPDEDRIPAELLPLLETIRIRCPRCHAMTLSFLPMGFWD